MKKERNRESFFLNFKTRSKKMKSSSNDERAPFSFFLGRRTNPLQGRETSLARAPNGGLPPLPASSSNGGLDRSTLTGRREQQQQRKAFALAAPAKTMSIQSR